MHLGWHAFCRRINAEGWMLEGGVGQRREAGSGIEGSVRSHAEVWIGVVVGRVEGRWLSKVRLEMRMLEGKHLRRGATAYAGAGVRLGGDGDGPDVARDTGRGKGG
jgi:hypothetical protein